MLRYETQKKKKSYCSGYLYQSHIDFVICPLSSELLSHNNFMLALIRVLVEDLYIKYELISTNF